MLGGALACGFTHAGITPLDVTKCNMQVCPWFTKIMLLGEHLIEHPYLRLTLQNIGASSLVSVPLSLKKAPEPFGKDSAQL